MFFSVLEQFEITKFSLNWLFSLYFFLDKRYKKIITFITKNLLLINYKFFAIKLRYRTLKLLLVKFLKMLQSFFLPNSYSTKNYTYSRIMQICLKNFFKLLVKRKLSIFFRFAPQIIKIKIQLKLQQLIKTNFGDSNPYYRRLLNYYPYLFLTSFLIVCHNFNGLLFYGFTNTAFLLQNLVISFQAVVGLTFLEFLLDPMLFIKCLFRLMYQKFFCLF